MPGSSAKLISKANAAAILFMQTEVYTGLSFVRMATNIQSRKKPRPGDAAKMNRYMEYAHLAYATVLSRLGTTKAGPEELRAINEKIAELEKILEQY